MCTITSVQGYQISVQPKEQYTKHSQFTDNSKHPLHSHSHSMGMRADLEYCFHKHFLGTPCARQGMMPTQVLHGVHNHSLSDSRTARTTYCRGPPARRAQTSCACCAAPPAARPGSCSRPPCRPCAATAAPRTIPSARATCACPLLRTLIRPMRLLSDALLHTWAATTGSTDTSLVIGCCAPPGWRARRQRCGGCRPARRARRRGPGRRAARRAPRAARPRGRL